MQGYNISNSFNFKQSSIIRPTSTTLSMPKFLPVALDLLNWLADSSRVTGKNLS